MSRAQSTVGDFWLHLDFGFVGRDFQIRRRCCCSGGETPDGIAQLCVLQDRSDEKRRSHQQRDHEQDQNGPAEGEKMR